MKKDTNKARAKRENDAIEEDALEEDADELIAIVFGNANKMDSKETGVIIMDTSEEDVEETLLEADEKYFKIVQVFPLRCIFSESRK